MTEAQSVGRARSTDRVPTLAVSVVVCAYTERRWEQTRAALRSVLAQRPAPEQVLLVVDHNPGLADRARREVAAVSVLESDREAGLSGARNTGLCAASQPVTVFLDDDAEARPDWLSALVEPYRRPGVVATGGGVHPRWPTRRPRWLPLTFDWVVGCSYQGLPREAGVVRNPIGANMSMRTAAALAAGGFAVGVGRTDSRPRGCEETELAIRLTARQPGSSVFYVPDARVDHCVAPERVSVRYFVRRCWHEGMSKADVVQLAGAADGLARERRHVAAVIPTSMLRDVCAAVTGDVAGLARASVAGGGLAVTATGYLAGCLLRARRFRAHSRAEPAPSA